MTKCIRCQYLIVSVSSVVRIPLAFLCLPAWLLLKQRKTHSLMNIWCGMASQKKFHLYSEKRCRETMVGTGLKRKHLFYFCTRMQFVADAAYKQLYYIHRLNGRELHYAAYWRTKTKFYGGCYDDDDDNDVDVHQIIQRKVEILVLIWMTATNT